MSPREVHVEISQKQVCPFTTTPSKVSSIRHGLSLTTLRCSRFQNRDFRLII